MEEELKAKNMCIVNIMNAMDSVLTTKAKIEVVQALNVD